jgi:hypothetical protein
MSDLKLTTATTAENPVLHDLELDGDRLVWVGLEDGDTADAGAMIAQRAACRILLWRGEWYLDQRIGTPWKQTLLGRITEARIKAVLRGVLLAAPGIASVVSIDVIRDTEARTARVRWIARADTGAVIGPESIDIPFVPREAT